MDLTIKKNELLDKQEALLTVAKGEDRGLNVDEQTKFNDYDTEISNIEATIEMNIKLDERVKARKEVVTEPIHAEVISDKPKWKNSGEFLKSVASASSGGTIDKRLRNAEGANEAVGSEGGFLVGDQLLPLFLEKMHDSAVVAGNAFKVPIGPNANGVKINGIDESSRANGSRWGGVQAYWAYEAGTVTSTKPAFKKESLDLDKLMAIFYATDELLQDSVALGSIVERAFAEEMAFKLDDALINGTGAGQPQGILLSDAMIGVAKETDQAADSIVFENIVKMWSRMWAKSRSNATWYINQDIEPQLFALSLAVGTGGVPVYMPANGLSGSPYGTLLGRPVVPIEQCPTVGDLGDIILADMSQYLLIEKGGVDMQESVHVKFIYDESCFRFVYRVNGMPMWDSTLTPFKGSNTQSPFVGLAARA